MTKGQLIKEFKRWLDSGKPDVWTRHVNDTGNWEISRVTIGGFDNYTYIVNDKHAELRKLQIDKPNTEFQYKDPKYGWISVKFPLWDLDTEYRVKPKEWYEDENMIGKPVWVKDTENEEWKLRIYNSYKNVSYKNVEFFTKSVVGYGSLVKWYYAKPVICDDIYREE